MAFHEPPEMFYDPHTYLPHRDMEIDVGVLRKHGVC